MNLLDKVRIDDILRDKAANACLNCGQAITQDDIAWNNGCTEWGTGHCTVFCQCPRCDYEVFYIFSWYPSIDDLYDLAYVLDTEEWKCNE